MFKSSNPCVRVQDKEPGVSDGLNVYVRSLEQIPLLHAKVAYKARLMSADLGCVRDKSLS